VATDATGTPSTNHSIPKYNTSVDAPSGLGLNAIVDYVDSLVNNVATLFGAVARTIVRKNGTGVGTRRAINFIEGSNVTLTVTDDVVNEEVEVTIAAASSSSAEKDYQTKTSNTVGTSTTEAGADTVITGNAFTAENVRHAVTFATPRIETSGGNPVTFVFLRDSTVIGQVRGNSANSFMHTVFSTPPAGSVTYSVKVFSTSAQTHTIHGGTGLTGNLVPVTLQVTKV
jgi:hypothetical protein